jgi:hypothetical protein
MKDKCDLCNCRWNNQIFDPDLILLCDYHFNKRYEKPKSPLEIALDIDQFIYKQVIK